MISVKSVVSGLEWESLNYFEEQDWFLVTGKLQSSIFKFYSHWKDQIHCDQMIVS